jgi:preprotein translocase subunit SecG
MVSLVLAVHISVCIALVIIILLQQGKGADVGAVFGGSSQTVFGSSGAGNMMTRVTSGLAVVFFATSMYLAYMSTQRATGSIFGSGASSVMPKQAAPKVPAPAPNPGNKPAPGAPANQ